MGELGDQVEETTENTETTETTDEIVVNSGDPSTWNWGEGIPGEGEKPEFFNDSKYANILEQAKAQPEAERMMGAFVGAPETYNVAISEELADAGFSIADDDVMLANFKETAKELKMNQEGFDQIITRYGEIEVAKMEQNADLQKKYDDEQLKALGPNGSEQIKDILDWGGVNLEKEHAEGLKEIPLSTKTVKILQALIAKTEHGALSPDEVGQASTDLQAEILEMQFEEDKNGNRRIITDSAFNADYEAKKKTLENMQK
jgi:hypothetical protein